MATEDSNNADKLLYRTLLTIEKILLNYSKNESKLLLLHCKEIKLDWYIPDIPRILLIVQEFLNIQNNTNKYKVLDHIQYLLSIVNHRQHSTVTVDIENVIEESINKTAPLTIFSRPSGFYIQFKRSGNVYHTISENDVKGLAQEINSQIINALTDIRIVHFQITNQCHLRCKHCLYYHGTGNMKLNTITDLLDQFSKSGICEVDFGEGGEATLHPALSKIICYTVEKCKMIPNLTTNLLCLLSDELVDVLSQCAGSVTLSLDNYHYPAFAKEGFR